ncbi:MAG TPA: hypothetical protein VJK05_01770 [archaeon]|nr:hypothetical protein [archaeon]
MSNQLPKHHKENYLKMIGIIEGTINDLIKRSANRTTKDMLETVLDGLEVPVLFYKRDKNYLYASGGGVVLGRHVTPAYILETPRGKIIQYGKSYIEMPFDLLFTSHGKLKPRGIFTWMHEKAHRVKTGVTDWDEVIADVLASVILINAGYKVERVERSTLGSGRHQVVGEFREIYLNYMNKILSSGSIDFTPDKALISGRHFDRKKEAGWFGKAKDLLGF